MRYQITGKQIDVGEALQTHVKTELGSVIEKYAGRPTDGTVIFSKSGHEYVCETTVHLSTGLTCTARHMRMKFMLHSRHVLRKWTNNCAAISAD